MSHNPAMSTTDKFERHYRQQLSALVDGELSADESRFLLRRLAHDEELAGCHERWQLCGDVLRGAASAPAPLEFAARVRSAIADEPVPQAQPATRPAARWRWVVARRLRHLWRRSPCSWRASVCPRRRRLPPRCRCSPRPRRCPPQCSRLQRRKRRRHRIRPHPTRVSRSLQRCLPLRWLPPVAVRPRAISRRPAVLLPASSRHPPAWWPLPRRHRLLRLCVRPRRRTRSRIPR